MGNSFPTSSISPTAISSAKVITPNGSLINYHKPAEASVVLGLNRAAFFLCDADKLFYGHRIQALDDNHLVELGKLYFLLPAKRLNHPLTAAEMAALAVRANSAFADDLMRKKKKKGSCVQVMPDVESDGYEKFNERSVGSWRKIDDVKLKVLRKRGSEVKGSYRPRLSSINEEVYE